MGGAVSAGTNNKELIDNLVDAGYIKDDKIQRVFRAVDRGNYYLPQHRISAYKDSAWKHGHLHLSAPCIYSEVMEALKLNPSQSFLNLGSGTGYLSTMAGLLLGAYGVNHGIEQHSDVIEYAESKLEEFLKESTKFDEFEFCSPEFIHGNCLLLQPGNRLYDRVYCGAACPPEHVNYMKNLIKIDGILVMPLDDNLVQITRTGEAIWRTQSVLPVTFASLALPDPDITNEFINLPEVNVLQLQDICRHSIRLILHQRIVEENPDILLNIIKKPKKASKNNRTRSNKVNRRSRNSVQDDLEIDIEESEPVLSNDDDDDMVPDVRSLFRTVHQIQCTGLPGFIADDEICPNVSVAMVNGLSVEDQSSSSTNSSSSESIDHTETTDRLENTHIQQSQVIPIEERRHRTSLNSTSTSCTSGIGTCSSSDGMSEYLGNSQPSQSICVPNQMSDLKETETGASSSEATDNGHTVKRFASSSSSDSVLSNEDIDSNLDSYFSDTSSDDDEEALFNLLQSRAALNCNRPSISKRKKEAIVSDDEESKLSFRRLMYEKVNKLPVPPALKKFLHFYRPLPGNAKPEISEGDNSGH